MRKWYLAIFVLVNARRIPSARVLATILQVNKNTANYMAMRVRHWMPKERDFLLRIADEVEKQPILLGHR